MVQHPLRVHPHPLEALWRALTHFERKKINLWMGLRNALGVALPLGLGVALGYSGSGLVAATGALNVGLPMAWIRTAIAPRACWLQV